MGFSGCGEWYRWQDEVVFHYKGEKQYSLGENRLANPGFETVEIWRSYGKGYQLGSENQHSGTRSLTIIPLDENEQYGAYQRININLDPDRENKIIIGGWCRNEGFVTGQLYVDIYSEDGTETQYGLVVDFDPNVSQIWQYNQKIFDVKINKPSFLLFYVMIRGQKGAKVNFDDLFMGKVLEEVDDNFSIFDDAVVALPAVEAEQRRTKSFSLHTEDGCMLGLSKGGTFTDLKIDDKNFVSNKSISSSGFFIRDVGKGADFIRPAGYATQLHKRIWQIGRSQFMQLMYDLSYTAKEDYIEINGTIKNLVEEDRAITVYFALPIDATGWQFWRDIRSSTSVLADKIEYRNGGRTGSAGWCSNYPISVISGDINLSFGIKLDEPRIVRMTYNADVNLYFIAFDLALSPKTKKIPNKAKFSFIIFKSPPEWGFRSAIKRYYDFYPAFFKKRVDREGNWLVASSVLSEDTSPLDFGLMFHHSLVDVDWGDQLGIYSCDYFNPKVKVYCLWDAKVEPSVAAIEEALRADDNTLPFQASSKDVKLISNSALYDESGQLYDSVNKVGWFVDKIWGNADENGWAWCGVFRLNPDPDIPYGSGQSAYSMILKRADDYKKMGMITDGVSFDGISTSFVNFREKHFEYVDYPLSFDYTSKRPVIIDAFSNYECLKYIADHQHLLGKIIMANGFPSHYMYGSHLIDSGNDESSKPFSDSHANLARTLLYQKPYSCMLKGDFSSLDVRSMLGSYMRKSLFYGIYLTVYNVSGGGEDSNYFEHPEWYDNDRYIFKKYIPLIRNLSLAGWEPITYTRSSDEEVFVERYGEYFEDDLYFTLLNSTNTLKAINLSVDKTKLKIGDVNIVLEDVLEGGELIPNDASGMEFSVSILGGEVKLLKVK